MTRSRRVSFLPPQARVPAGSSGRLSPSPDSSADNQAAMRVIAVALLIQTLRSRRVYERAAVAAVVLAALGGLNREGRAKSIAALVRWAKRQDERLDRKAKAALTN